MHTAESSVQFALCIASEADSDLEAWKVYRVLPDPKSAVVDCLRVIDESGEDYLYPCSRFVMVELPPAARAQLLATVAGREQ